MPNFSSFVFTFFLSLFISISTQAQQNILTKYFVGIKGNTVIALSGYFDVDAYFAKRLAPSFALGLKLGYSTDRLDRTFITENEDKFNIFGSNTSKISVFGRFNIFQKKGFFLEIEGDLGYESSRENEPINIPFSGKSLAINLGPLVGYHISNRFTFFAYSSFLKVSYDQFQFQPINRSTTEFQGFYGNLINDFKLGFDYNF